MKIEKKQAMQTRIAELERKLFEARASYAATYGTAFDAISKASSDYMGSGVVIQMNAIGGKEIIPPVMIRDGISAATVKAIQDDLRRSFELATMVNPAMVRS